MLSVAHIAALAGRQGRDPVAPPSGEGAWFIAMPFLGGETMCSRVGSVADIDPASLRLWRAMYKRGWKGKLSRLGFRAARAPQRGARPADVSVEPEVGVAAAWPVTDGGRRV